MEDHVYNVLPTSIFPAIKYSLKFTQESLHNAIEAVRLNSQSLRKAGLQYGKVVSVKGCGTCMTKACIDIKNRRN